nr:hypothetical protein [Pseudanabaena sp. SR411]
MKLESMCLIFNPVAGQGNPEQDLALIKSILEPAIAPNHRQLIKLVGT